MSTRHNRHLCRCGCACGADCCIGEISSICLRLDANNAATDGATAPIDEADAEAAESLFEAPVVFSFFFPIQVQ